MFYKAFISYSHHSDPRLAPAIQKGIHRFTKPWYRLRALHIFRDQTNLSVAPGLWPEIVKALGESEFLLTLASPEAAASKWIDREIAWWLEHRGPERILMLLTDGSLVWDDESGGFCREGSTALNPRLADVFPQEPLWLDLRWSRDEPDLSLRNGRFKDIIAAISARLQGVSKDRLIGEDLIQYRRTRYVAWSAVALLAVLAVTATGMAWLADQQRTTAERRLVDLLYTPSGLQALDDGDWAAALLWFVEALKLDSGDDKWEPVHRARIAAILAAHPRLVDVRFHHEPVIAVELGPCGGILSADLGGEVQFGRLDSRIVNKFDLTLGDGILKSAQLANCDTRLLAHTMDNSFDHETGHAILWDTGSGSQLDWQRQDGSRFEQLQASDILLRGINALVVDTQTEIWSSVDGSQISGDVGLPGPGWFSGKLEVSGSGRFGAFLDITSTWIDEGSIEVWDLDMNAPVLTDLRGIAVAFDPLDRWMAVGSREGHGICSAGSQSKNSCLITSTKRRPAQPWNWERRSDNSNSSNRMAGMRCSPWVMPAACRCGISSTDRHSREPGRPRQYNQTASMTPPSTDMDGKWQPLAGTTA